MSSALATVDSAVTLTPRVRQAQDFYREPAEAVRALLAKEQFEGWSLDPACGLGNIPDEMSEYGCPCSGSDILDRGWRGDHHLHGSLWLGARDFIKPMSEGELSNRSTDADNIVCNPPFALAEQFIDRALVKARGKVAMLLRLSFLEGQRRASMFRDTPLSRVWVFPWRISMPPGDQAIEAKGGAVAFAWYVWDKLRRPEYEPRLGWLEKPKA